MSTFPGATSITFLEVYEDVAPDGLRGGSPHLHLASTECYIVTAGTGALQTIDQSGYRETPLTPGSTVWFTPGTIHRAVNFGNLSAIVLMQNAGLPEAGDAILAFPDEYLSDRARYDAVARLPEATSQAVHEHAAMRRRDLAVEGFLALRDAVRAGDAAALEHFYDRAAQLAASVSAEWGSVIREGPAAQAQHSLERLDDLRGGLASGRVAIVDAGTLATRFGMCGRLRPLDGTIVSAAEAVAAVR